jgi:hypothetical protein
MEEILMIPRLGSQHPGGKVRGDYIMVCIRSYGETVREAWTCDVTEGRRNQRQVGVSSDGLLGKQ